MADSKIVVPTDVTIAAAAQALAAGKLIGVPTETVYGLAADATNQLAVERIFQAKGRPANNPLIAHFANADQARRWINVDDDATITWQWNLATTFWPGPLTVVAPLRGSVAPAVTAGAETLAVRVPNHPVMQSLLESFALPIAAPSANRSNYVSPTQANHVATAFGDSIEMVLDGGPCDYGVESTIIRLTPTVPQLLRPGGISTEQLVSVFGDIELIRHQAPASPSANTDSAGVEPASLAPLPSPGLMRKHYSPQTRLIKASEFDLGKMNPAKVARLYFSPQPQSDRPIAFGWIRVLSPTGDLNEVARHLFAAIREADQLPCELIVIDECSNAGIGHAIMDRVHRAAT
ncbi:L-threonylcarbamoyladenylate synthase [Roseiconus lacunae]|uniref:L-threonylcarbamoyladenylate synthase n=1 Tax=Roseiconus lacunae TaxID=2605694 RepID=UPI00308B212A|nr:L-threonylcarbamoyladenylate synthase [Stieleria sp. HD01]